MMRIPTLPLGSLLICCFLATVDCGGSRQLKSVALNPPTADARSFPNGQVPFTALGTFTQPPSPVPLTSNDVHWCVGQLTNEANPTAGLCNGNVAPFATVDQNGVAQCAANSQGTVFILAGEPASAAMNDQGQQLKIYGSAQLTCP